MADKFFRIEAIINRGGRSVVEPLEVARIQGGVAKEAILARYEHTARGALEDKGFTEEEAVGARLQLVEIDRNEFATFNGAKG